MSKIDQHITLVMRFLVNFFVFSFFLTCSILLFIHGLDIEMDAIKANAVNTFLNIFVLTFIYVLIDYIRDRAKRKAVVNRIMGAVNSIESGDFSVELAMFPQWYGMDEFNDIFKIINQLSKELSGSETMKSDFIANVSHELKTPLAIINNYAVLLENSELSEERLTYLHTISNTSKNLADLVSNVLRLNKLENQQIVCNKKVYYLNESISKCLLNFEAIWEEKEIDIDVMFDEVLINNDAELLELVWNNLLSNAFKFTDNNGNVKVKVIDDNDYVLVSISDSGCGISKEVGMHIFDKFYQGDTSHSTKGNGLGLALVKRVIDVIDGEIYVDSVVNEGTTFSVRLKKGL